MLSRLGARRAEIVQGIFALIREAVPDGVGDGDTEYLAGLRDAVAASVDFALAGIEQGCSQSEPVGLRAPVPVPERALGQARRAARSGVSLQAVLQRYFVGHSRLWDYVMEEADREGCSGGQLRDIHRAQSTQLERLAAAISREYIEEREQAGRSREQRVVDTVRALLSSEAQQDRGGAHVAQAERELGCEFDVEHVGAIATGEGAEQVLRDLAVALDRRLLSVAMSEDTVWAWLSGTRGVRMTALAQAFAELPYRSAGRREPGGGTGERASELAICHPPEEAIATADAPGERSSCVELAVGEPAWGFAGWRSTHRQAQAALLVALHRPRPFTRYADVALLASALKDRPLADALIDIYVRPIERCAGASGTSGAVLRRTLRAYLVAERNISSTAAALGIARRTVEYRLRTIEERLERSLHPCAAEIEIALELAELRGDLETDSVAPPGLLDSEAPAVALLSSQG